MRDKWWDRRRHRSVLVGAVVAATVAVMGAPPAWADGVPLCSTQPSTAANVNTDCTPNGPHNEGTIAVNPTDPNNIIGGANDYINTQTAGGTVSVKAFSRAHVTFDGGRSWSEYPLAGDAPYQGTGDPSVAFDADGHAYYSTLGLRYIAGGKNNTAPDVLTPRSSWRARTETACVTSRGR